MSVPRPWGSAVETDEEARECLRRAQDYLMEEPPHGWCQILYQARMKELKELRQWKSDLERAGGSA
jgi:hypothetical protein